jgi:L-serine dehydratase
MGWDIFDIVGPIMVGPSSSHTSGAVRLGLLARQILGGTPQRATIYLHGSYAEVYKGHGTDLALVAGLLGFAPDSENVVKAFSQAKKMGMEFDIVPTDLGSCYHPNTAKFLLKKDKIKIEIVGQSIGGGNVEIVEINGIKTSSLDGKYDTLITLQKDKPGLIAQISGCLSQSGVNIAQMSTSRVQKDGDALSVYNLDKMPPGQKINKIEEIKYVKWARIVSKL